MILAGDIGGTSTRLGLFESAGPRLRAVAEQTYSSPDHPGLEAIIAKFLAEHPASPRAAAFGIAGPVVGNVVRTPNLAWVIDGAALAGAIGLPRIGLINDLEANAWGIAELSPTDFVTLHPGAPNPAGNRAVIAAGTGLGEAGLFWDGRMHHPFACEGGHTDFAPRDAEEAALLAYLSKQFERVSYERVVSGPGLQQILAFLRDAGSAGTLTDALAAAMASGDASAAISQAAIARSDPVAVKALDMFVSIYGAEAGNLAVKMLATGGVFIGGGIAPRILEQLRGGPFLQAFLAKGRMRTLMESMPVRVILNDKTALLGAARFAARQAGQAPGA